MNVVGELF